jgi:hypothetical protein
LHRAHPYRFKGRVIELACILFDHPKSISNIAA